MTDRRADARLHACLHTLWTKAVGTDDYIKAEWRDFANLIAERQYGGRRKNRRRRSERRT